MISVVNRTETAARVAYAFTHGKIRIDELKDPARTLHIDSKVLEKAEAREEIALESVAGDEAGDGGGGSQMPPEAAAVEEGPGRMASPDRGHGREAGQAGRGIQNVISVGMLSEGWDAKTVTHIMGLRAFSSQLLCEQVVGRGLRRTSYEVGAGRPVRARVREHLRRSVHVPSARRRRRASARRLPTRRRESSRTPRREEFEISWPNIVRIGHEYRPGLILDTGESASADDRCCGNADPCGAGPRPGGKARHHEDHADRPRGTRPPLPPPEDHFRGGPGRLRPDGADWKGSREDLLAQVVAPGRGVPAERRRRDRPAALSPGRAPPSDRA